MLWKTFRHCGIDLFGGKSSTDNIDAYLIFHLKLRASNLLVAPYIEYQQFLYETISKYLEEGWNYRQIADWLNDNGYTTVRGKRFRNAHTHSIVKKKKMSDERHNRMYPSSLTNCSLEVTDKRIVNS